MKGDAEGGGCPAIIVGVRYLSRGCPREALPSWHIPGTEGPHVKRSLAGLVQRGLRQAAGDRNHPIEKIVLRSAGLTRQPDDTQLDQMAAAVSSTLSPLLSVAMSGNVHAIRKVTELAAQLCAETTALACMHQQAADTVARERTAWPLNLSHDPKERRRALKLVTGPRRLPLGNPAPPPLKVERKPSGLSNPANAALLVALKAIEIERAYRIPSELFPTLQPKWSTAAAELPDLQPATAEAWFEVIWLYLCDRHDGAPEKSELKKLVGDVPEAQVRATLERALEQAFLQLARGSRRLQRRGR